eukprot:2704514-Rhodomonas_salina.1
MRVEGGANRHQLTLYDTTGRLVFYLNYPEGNKQIQTADAVPLNRWVYIAVVFSGQVITMYFDGTDVGSVTAPAGVVQVDRVWSWVDF